MMAKLGNLTVSVEKTVVHDSLREFAERLYSEYGIQLLEATFDWLDISKRGENNAQVMDIRIESQTKTEGGALPASPGSPVLCYVKGQWAYFTTQKISEQWGDDWNDAPYEYNAGTPYEYVDHDRKEGRAPWQIVKVAWDGDFETPRERHPSSPWSVEQINAGAAPWLRTRRWHSGEPVIIRAGTTLEHFCELIREGGGAVYLANDQIEARAGTTNNGGSTNE
jgi:hypothetical protein